MARVYTKCTYVKKSSGLEKARTPGQRRACSAKPKHIHGPSVLGTAVPLKSGHPAITWDRKGILQIWQRSFRGQLWYDVTTAQRGRGDSSAKSRRRTDACAARTLTAQNLIYMYPNSRPQPSPPAAVIQSSAPKAESSSPLLCPSSSPMSCLAQQILLLHPKPAPRSGCCRPVPWVRSPPPPTWKPPVLPASSAVPSNSHYGHHKARSESFWPPLTHLQWLFWPWTTLLRLALKTPVTSSPAPVTPQSPTWLWPTALCTGATWSTFPVSSWNFSLVWISPCAQLSLFESYLLPRVHHQAWFPQTNLSPPHQPAVFSCFPEPPHFPQPSSIICFLCYLSISIYYNFCWTNTKT